MNKFTLTMLWVCFTYLTSSAQLFDLELYASGFTKPVDIASTYINGDKRLFIVEKDGKIKIINADKSVNSTAFLDIDSKVNSGANERGLLGLAFHPQFNNNGYFFVNYTNSGGHTVIARYKADSPDATTVNASTEKIILTINQPFNNHNGGDLNFGVDGYLYIGMGDGGNGGDPGNRSQNPKDLLGKMLRIDINTETAPYVVPSTNPYFGKTDTLPEIWSIGLRNPWRFSFDRMTHEMWIADVGQDEWEEINVEPQGKGGLNYGWRCYEGKAPFNLSGCGNKSKYTDPIHAYANRFDTGCSVTGGYVYRGTQSPSLYGKYLYTDFCTGKWWSITKQADGNYVNKEVADLDNEEYSTLGEATDGELYVAALGDGRIYRIRDKASDVHDMSNSGLNILSNPADRELLWTYTGDQKVSTWTIVNLSGQKVKTILEKSNSGFNHSCDISDLSSGVYILLAVDHPELKRKFVKNNP
jgi:glucose/arabinose dehydrogenase